jgi:hypothetical protein
MNHEHLKCELANLPLRAIVAFAARCARRVRPLAASLPEDSRVAIDQAITVAEAFARGDKAVGAAVTAGAAVGAARGAEIDGVTETAVGAAWAAAQAAEAVQAAKAAEAFGAAADNNFAVQAAEAADQTARCAALAVGNATLAVRSAALAVKAIASVTDRDHAILADIEQIIAFRLGEPGTLGSPIDPSEAGPLGPLWPGGEPAWLRKLDDEGYKALGLDEPADAAELAVEVEVPEDASDEDVLTLVDQLVLHADNLHRSLGGHGLKIEGLEVHQSAGVPEGVPRG